MSTTDVANPERAVLNQPPELEPLNLFECDLALAEALEREGGGWGRERARETGAVAGSVEAREHCRRAERNEPILHTHDRFGNRIDEVELDPSWHWLLRGAIERGIAGLPWHLPRPGAHVVRAALFLVWAQVNDGVMCPVSMTYAAVPALRDGSSELAADLGAAPDDARLRARRDRRDGDDRAPGRLRRARQHHARAPGRRTAPRSCTATSGSAPTRRATSSWSSRRRPAGSPASWSSAGPGMEFQRLKDKLGGRSLASSEVELRGVRAHLLGEQGRGVPTIIRMVNHTRLDCMLGAAGGYRRGVVEAIHHARHRSAFGRCSCDQPAMRNVLADLALDSEAAGASALRVARSYDRPEEADFRRFATAVMKYWITKRAPGHAAEALECLGGNGFVEESRMPLLYRGAPVNSVWEGSGNVAALDVLRALLRQPEGVRGVPGRMRAGQRRRPAARRAPRVGARACGAPARGGRRRPQRQPRGGCCAMPSSACAASSRTWRSRCRARCWSVTRPRRSRMRSPPGASVPHAGGRTVRSQPA